MTTEIDSVQDLLDQFDPKNEFGDLKWQIVDDAERKASATKYLDDRVTRALLESKTVRIDGVTSASKYRRWANANDMRLNVKHKGDKTFVWAEKRKAESGTSGKG